jgi:hypothetical protein
LELPVFSIGSDAKGYHQRLQTIRQKLFFEKAVKSSNYTDCFPKIPKPSLWYGRICQNFGR